jgi:hypothetical protein
MSEWISKAQWDLECYRGQYGDGVSTDKHPTREAAEAVCRILGREGFGCEGKHFPTRTWVVKEDEVDEIHNGIRAQTQLIEQLKSAQETVEQLQKDRKLSDEQLRQKFDI